MISEINESLGVDRHTCICGVPFCTNMLRPLPKILLVLETTDAPTGRPASEKPCRASSRAASQPGDCLRDSIVSGDVIFVVHKDMRVDYEMTFTLDAQYHLFTGRLLFLWARI